MPFAAKLIRLSGGRTISQETCRNLSANFRARDEKQLSFIVI